MFADELRTFIEAHRNNLPKFDASSFVDLCTLLQFTYYVIVASEQLTQEAADNSTGALKDYFLEHLEEERSHAAWLAEDLLSAGIDVKGKFPPADIAALPGFQYYLLKHVSPVALLGYMAYLEFFPASMEFVELCEQLHGKALIRTYRYHAANDPQHGDDLAAVINQLNKEEQDIVLNSTKATCEMFEKALWQIG